MKDKNSQYFNQSNQHTEKTNSRKISHLALRVLTCGLLCAYAQSVSAPVACAQGPAETVTSASAYASDAVKHYNTAHDLQSSGFLNQAIVEYKAAIEADSRLERAWSNLGSIYASQRSFHKALDAFQKALAIKPNSPETLNGMASVFFDRGKLEKAKLLWHQAIEINPKFAAAHFNIGNALENEHQLPSAAQEYVKAIEIDPKMGEAFYRVAMLYLKEEHLAQARVMFAEALILGPAAEYMRDAKKQLSALDAAFSSDPTDRYNKSN